MKFTVLAELVLKLRDEAGLHGIVRERSRYRCHIATADFATLDVEEIRRKHIRAWLRWMDQRQAVVHLGQAPKLLSRETTIRCKSLLSAIFDEAVERELIDVNPCDLVKYPRRGATGKDKWDYHSRSEQLAMMGCEAIPPEHRRTIAFALATGLRQGEQFSLELADIIVDGPNPRVIVRYSVPHKGKKTTPKNGLVREVPLMGEALTIAREWLAMLPTYAAANPLGLVFPTPRGCRRAPGRPLGNEWPMARVYALAGFAKRPRLHWHSLRHTYASNLISGVFGRRWHLSEIQVLLGHADIQTTQRYAHLGNDAIRVAVHEAEVANMPSLERLVRLGALLFDHGRQLVARLAGEFVKVRQIAAAMPLPPVPQAAPPPPIEVSGTVESVVAPPSRRAPTVARAKPRPPARRAA